MCRVSGEAINLISVGAFSEVMKSPAFNLGPFILGITMVKSSAAFVGLYWCWVVELTRPPFFDEFALLELILAGLPIFVGASLIVLAAFAGVFGLLTGLTAGLLGGVSVLAGFLVEYGSAVAGRATSALRRGRTGAEDNVPMDVVDTFREAADMAVAGLLRLGCMTDFLGDPKGSADPGRSGRCLPASFAFFCAAMVSLIDGLVGTEVVL